MRTAQQNSSRQRGVSLFIVLIVLLLSLIVVLGGLAVGNLNEILVGNQGDAQRAYSAAQALLDAAQRDIRLNGRYCNAAGLGQEGTNPTIQTDGAAAKCSLRYPSDGNGLADYMALVSLIDGLDINSDGKCGNTPRFIGVCISRSPTSPNFQVNNIDASNSAQKWINGASYRQTLVNDLPDYGSKAKAGDTTLTLGENSDSRGKYWVEVFPYNVMDQSWKPTPLAPDGSYPFVFRITAKAKGLKSNTVSVLRTYYIPYPIN